MVQPIRNNVQKEDFCQIQGNRLFRAVAARNSLKIVLLGYNSLKYIHLMGNCIAHFVVKQLFLVGCTREKIYYSL